MKCSKFLFFVSFAATTLPFFAHAQLLKSYGVKVGANWSTANIAFTEQASPPNWEIGTIRRPGFNAAIFVEGLKFSAFSLVAQAEYAKRGFDEKRAVFVETEVPGVGRIYAAVGGLYATTILNYVSIPVLIKWQSPVKTTKPYLLFGPKLDFLVNRKVGRFKKDPEVYFIEREDGYAERFADRKLGGTAGLGLTTNKVLSMPLSLEARYNFDFAYNLDEKLIRAKNNAFDVWLGITF